MFDKTCIEWDCDRPITARLLCKMHWQRWARMNPSKVNTGTKKWFNADGSRMTCSQPRCNLPVKCQGMCNNHYSNFMYHIRKDGK